MTAFHEPELRREYAVLFPTSLDEAIPRDHPARYVDTIINSTILKETFDDWEMEYAQGDGRPAYHPRYMVSLYIYGLMNKTRSSREMEKACRTRLDFMWLMEMQQPDHSTIAAFVTQNKKRLNDLFKNVVRLCIQAQLVSFDTQVVDGTMIWANASRASVKKKQKLKDEEEKLNKYIENLQREWDENEKRQEAPSLFPESPPYDTPKNIEKAKEKLERIQQAIEKAEQRVRESIKGNTKDMASKTDPESRNCKDKQGRTHPCYNTQIAVDSQNGVIVATEVSDAASDNGKLPNMIEASCENTGRKPETVAADGAYGDGAALKHAEENGVVTYIPPADSPGGNEDKIKKTMKRLATGKPLSKKEIKSMPKNRKGLLPRECFTYQRDTNTYICPAGKTLHRLYDDKKKTTAGFTRRRFYGCNHCTECVYAIVCCSKKSRMRKIVRDEFEDCRERLGERMKTEEAEKIYSIRSPCVERPFAQVKANMGIRQFLRRGKENVTVEWNLIITAINISILIKNWDTVAGIL